jgi:hypothetical protein
MITIVIMKVESMKTSVGATRRLTMTMMLTSVMAAQYRLELLIGLMAVAVQVMGLSVRTAVT